jgi:hypothetical protein
MKCDKQKHCPMYERHGNNLCAKLFRVDKCPPEIKFMSKGGDRYLLLANEARVEVPGLSR